MKRCDTRPNTSAGKSKGSWTTGDEITALAGSENVYIKQTKTKAPAIGRRSLEKPDAVPTLAEPARDYSVAILTRLSRAKSGSLPVRYSMTSAMGVRRNP
jgi:hypothetical protein